MESVAASAAIPSSPSHLSFFSPKRIVPRRQSLVSIASKNREDEADRSSGSSPSPLSFFSPKRSTPRRQSLLPIASKSSRENDADLNSVSESTSLVPFLGNRARAPLSPFPNDTAMGLVLSAAAGRGWTTGSGMEGPRIPAYSDSADQTVLTFPWSLYTRSPRRRMRVAFTCNVCGQRTTRAINPHAYTDGTVFVQCCGCNVFHKLVDNLNLFHEMKCYVNPSFRYKGDVSFNYMDADDDQNIFPIL
ncbi:unnamed protein product [Musa acuminata subsp. malaccensis]|uniref:(wild Malaysian banana) hypothetical protein n=1 Tax=Musa acuminata subsp. malaccensis TaxID=214687 RepID=A0A804I6Y9_MUSAM|nr:PREDICTED: uncharacterized protein LOC103977279 isoform X1 [Musa acuminata subsp. malaccensis]XP_018678457.1 PREDICTED: uncharacterized protein LOC103977279 isoform X1 [Musa acuminata subsp. malaccensis]XP_018678458.1 PREDICTED: uncharacterized protein LOC103977279 isoform X1 [Musa acuminata subsp. malaccensis]CAG1848758.1 unnamed protein product [Musa acuminata subsp. malaccensis]